MGKWIIGTTKLFSPVIRKRRPNLAPQLPATIPEQTPAQAAARWSLMKHAAMMLLLYSLLLILLAEGGFPWACWFEGVDDGDPKSVCAEGSYGRLGSLIFRVPSPAALQRSRATALRAQYESSVHQHDAFVRGKETTRLGSSHTMKQREGVATSAILSSSDAGNQGGVTSSWLGPVIRRQLYGTADAGPDGGGKQGGSRTAGQGIYLSANLWLQRALSGTLGSNRRQLAGLARNEAGKGEPEGSATDTKAGTSKMSQDMGADVSAKSALLVGPSGLIPGKKGGGQTDSDRPKSPEDLEEGGLVAVVGTPGLHQAENGSSVGEKAGRRVPSDVVRPGVSSKEGKRIEGSVGYPSVGAQGADRATPDTTEGIEGSSRTLTNGDDRAASATDDLLAGAAAERPASLADEILSKAAKVLESWAHSLSIAVRSVAVVDPSPLPAGHKSVNLFPLEWAVVHLGYTPPRASMTWPDLFPGNESCPADWALESWVNGAFDYDAVLLRLPCAALATDWAKDVPRHHLQLSIASAVAQSNKARIPVLIASECRPDPSLFHCRDLVQQPQPLAYREPPAVHGRHTKGTPSAPVLLWLYHLPVARTRHLASLPFGSCSGPITNLSSPSKPKVGEVAYVTMLHSQRETLFYSSYMCGAVSLAHSIRRSGSKHDMVLLLGHGFSKEDQSVLKSAGWKVRIIRKLKNPHENSSSSYNSLNFSKLKLWKLKGYKKAIFIDSDLLVVNNMDFLFEYPELSARNNDGSNFNSGVMVVEPHKCSFDMLLERTKDVVSPNGGDQGFINQIFTWWHRLPDSVNFYKHIAATDPMERAKEAAYKSAQFAAEPGADVHAIHYLGRKPWHCYRDFDCNRLYPADKEFESEVASGTWWRLHDTMPLGLQKVCRLSGKRKANLEAMRQVLKQKRYPRHLWGWNSSTIKDPRKKLCLPGDKECKHWLKDVRHLKGYLRNMVPDLVPTTSAD